MNKIDIIYLLGRMIIVMDFKHIIRLFLKNLLRPIIIGIKKQDIFFIKLTMLAMQKLGRSKTPIHPKHLYDNNKNNYLKTLLDENNPDLFLDLGSGAGSEMLLAKSKGWTVYGIEQNPKNIELSIKRLKKNNASNFFLKKHNLENTPLPIDSKSIKLINFTNVLEHVKNRISLLKEISRIMKDDGICLISVPNSETFWKKLQRFVDIDSRDDPDHKIEYNLLQINEELEKSGLIITSNMHSIVPSFPFDGLLSLTAIISPNLYRLSQKIKRYLVKKNYIDTIGWIFEVKKV